MFECSNVNRMRISFFQQLGILINNKVLKTLGYSYFSEFHSLVKWTRIRDPWKSRDLKVLARQYDSKSQNMSCGHCLYLVNSSDCPNSKIQTFLWVLHSSCVIVSANISSKQCTIHYLTQIKLSGITVLFCLCFVVVTVFWL